MTVRLLFLCLRVTDLNGQLNSVEEDKEELKEQISFKDSELQVNCGSVSFRFADSKIICCLVTDCVLLLGQAEQCRTCVVYSPLFPLSTKKLFPQVMKDCFRQLKAVEDSLPNKRKGESEAADDVDGDEGDDEADGMIT